MASRTVLVRKSTSSPLFFSDSTLFVTRSIASCSLVILVETAPPSPCATERDCSASSCFSWPFSRFSFSICAFCLRTTACTSSAYDLRSPSMMRYRRCSSSSSASTDTDGSGTDPHSGASIGCGIGSTSASSARAVTKAGASAASSSAIARDGAGVLLHPNGRKNALGGEKIGEKMIDAQ
eukprot:scaffold76274_cov61-Phaeocystis_antarctica.AAC.4